MNKYLVSVIVPIFNVESYLEACLVSIAEQTYPKFEVLLINDGSTDYSEQMALEFTKKDQRFKLHSKVNEGLSAARNFGLDLANGDYICFIDSDDTIKPKFIESLLDKSVLHNADMTFCLTEVFSELENKSIVNDYFNKAPIDPLLFERSFNHFDLNKAIFSLQVTAWNKIYKTSFLKNISARFPFGLCFEDNPFFFRCILNAQRICFVNEQLYIYRTDRPGSILNSKFRKFFDHFEIMDLVEKELKVSSEIWSYYQSSFLNYKYQILLYWLTKINSEFKSEFFLNIKKELLSEYALVMENVENKSIKPKLKLMSWSNYTLYNVFIRILKINEG